MKHPLPSLLLAVVAAAASVSVPAGQPQSPKPGPVPDGWQPAAPPQPITPTFSHNPRGGPNGDGCPPIPADQREGLHGYWQKTFSVAGGKFSQFRAVRSVQDVAVPRRSAVVRVLWRDDKGKPVTADPPDEAL